MFMMMMNAKVRHKVRTYMDNYFEILRESESPTPISWPVREAMSEAYVEKGIEKMSETKQEQSNSVNTTTIASNTHDNCGTPECCGKCQPSVSEDARE